MRFMKSSKNLSSLALTVLITSCSPVTPVVVNNNPTVSPTINQNPVVNQNPTSTTTQKIEQTQDNTVSSENNNIEGYDGFQNQSKEKIDSTEDTDGLGGNSSNVYQYEGVGFYGQCVPAARRYIKAKYGYSFPFLGGIGNTGAYLFWEKAQPDSSKMERITYTGNNLPQQDDVIIYKPWKTNPYGHIAITKSVDNNGNITVVDSNWVKYEKGGEHVVKKSELSLIYGWYRPIKNKNNSVNQNPIVQQPTQVIQKQNKSPIINSIEINPTNSEVSIGAKQTVTLKSNVSDPDGDNLTYEWWFNNVMQRTGQNDSIELGKGTHVIKFQVRDGNGGIATQEKTIIITEKQVVTPSLDISKFIKTQYNTQKQLIINSRTELDTWYGNGADDAACDIIYSNQYSEYNFNNSQNFTSAKLKIRGVLSSSDASIYNMVVLLNDKVIYNGNSSFLDGITDIPYDPNVVVLRKIINWKTLEITLPNINSNNNIKIINNNNNGWIGVDWLELS